MTLATFSYYMGFFSAGFSFGSLIALFFTAHFVATLASVVLWGVGAFLWWKIFRREVS